jgi:hypothetical protein
MFQLIRRPRGTPLPLSPLFGLSFSALAPAALPIHHINYEYLRAAIAMERLKITFVHSETHQATSRPTW